MQDPTYLPSFLLEQHGVVRDLVTPTSSVHGKVSYKQSLYDY